MGNRAVIAWGEYSPETMGIYLHWNGGRDSVEGFLAAAKEITRNSPSYSFARLVQVIANFFGGGNSIGLGKCRELDCDNMDNGVYEVDPNTLEITGRKFNRSGEQNEYPLEEMKKAALESMPESYKKGGD